MAKRKALSKAARFEVFKRDSFTCQYCGRSAPEVILEVDHIVPVSKGGKDDILNLITSCRDCNRGKRDKKITDDSMVVKQKAQLDELNERREQMELMIQWKESLQQLDEQQIDAINDYIGTVSDYLLNDVGRKYIKGLIKRYGFTEVYTSAEIAFDKYYFGTAESWDFTVNKIGGVCYNRRKQQNGD